MQTTTFLAAVLIILGIAAFAYQGITYTSHKNVVDLGALQVSTATTRTFPLPPIVGGLAIASGIALLVLGKKKI